jgi:Ca2+-binding RTX toxin-like protein
VILGGTGGDTIVAGDGDNVVLGDNGQVSRAGGKLSQVLSTSTGADVAEAGGADQITTGSGNDTVVGGAAGDTIGTGDGNDIAFGDSAELDYQPVTGTLLKAFSIARSFGGNDTISGGAGQDVLVGGTGNDMVDGGAGNDLVLGDNASLDRSLSIGNPASPLFRALSGTQLYDPVTGQALVTSTWQVDPQGTSWWSDFQLTLLDLGGSAPANTFGDDYLAGGAGNDLIFGQNGNDVIQGDGSITQTGGSLSCGSNSTVGAAGVAFKNLVGACRGIGTDGVANTLFVTPSTDNFTTDGNDYIEGGAGSDIIFGNQGQDNIIGGSSNLFGQTALAQRPDSSNLIFGGSGGPGLTPDTARLSLGDTSANGHAEDADTIVANNGLIFDIVGTNGTSSGHLLTFNYDNGAGATLHVIPRAVSLLDYTPGGSTYAGTAAANDVVAASEIHGENGDDVIYGGGGNDVIYGDGQNDVIVGGYGSDWIDGGSGDDGILGDDGRMLVSRISSSFGEPLYGIVATDPSQINLLVSDSSGAQQTIVNPSGSLKYTAFLLPDNLDPAGYTGGAQNPYYRPTTGWAGVANDVIYGGLGDDSIHGGPGDDAISGAEAPVQSYTNNYDSNGVLVPGQADMRSDWYHPFNPGNVLGYDPVTTDARYSMFALYDNNNPLREILLTPGSGALYGGAIDPTQQNTANYHEWILDFDYAEGPVDTQWIVGQTTYAGVPTDGNDMLFGDLQNDWVVGGSGRDVLFLGWGDDLGNIDDRLNTDNGLNDVSTDTNPSYEDVVFGGAGRDAMIGNTGGDREIDWSGEFNSYMGPFNPYGAPSTSRLDSGTLETYLMAVGMSAGADQTLAARHGGSAARDGEPYGELGIVTSSDPQWGDQKGGSRDPQPGTGNSTRDVRTSAGTQIIQAPGTSPQGTSPLTVHADAYVNAADVASFPVVVGGTSGYTALVTVSDGTHSVNSTPAVIGNNGELTVQLDLRALNEGPLNVTASLTSPGGAVSPPVTTTTFKDTVAPGAPTISALTSVDGTTAKTFTVTITGGSGAVTASVTVTDSLSHSLSTLVPLDSSGNGSAPIDVSSLKDGLLVTSVTVSDVAGNPSPATTWNTTKTGNVVTVTATDANGSEQLRDPITFVVTRSGDTTASLTVSVTWAGISPTATFGTDYTVSSNATQTTVTIAAGQASATVIVTPVDDSIAEPTENVSLTINSGTGYTVGTQSSASGSITDNDGPASVSIVATQSAGAEQNQVPIIFTVTRGTNVFSAITIGLGWSGTATRGTDYTVTVTGGTLNNNQTTLSLASGVTTATVTLTPVDDTIVEPQETAILTLNSGTGYTVVAGQSSATGTIDDNDALAVVTVVATDASGSEQGQDPIDFTITRTTNTIKQLVFNLTWTGTATLTTDYVVTTSTPGATLSANKLQLTLASGVFSAVIHVTPVDDTIVEPTETVILTLATGTGYTVGSPSSATGNITDNDGTPVVTVAATDSTGAEQNNDPIVFTITRAGNTVPQIAVNLTWGGTAVKGTNYTISGVSGGTLQSDGSILLATGVTSATVTVRPVDDTIFEGTQTVTLTIASGTGYSVGSPATASGTITDNDTPPPPVITTPTETTYMPVTITGTGTAGATITLLDGLTTLGTTTVAANGTWSFSPASMAVGNHTISARQTYSGVDSQLSPTITITITAPPAPVLNPPTVGSTKKGVAPVTFTGTGIAGALVTIRDATRGIVLATATVAANGSWTVTVSLSTGSYSATATQVPSGGVPSGPSVQRVFTVQ